MQHSYRILYNKLAYLKYITKIIIMSGPITLKQGGLSKGDAGENEVYVYSCHYYNAR